MKKLFPVFFFIFFFSLSSPAQPLYPHWTKFFGGTMSEIPRDAVATFDGGVVFTGLTSSYDGDVPYSPPDTLNGMRYNIMVGKIDSNKQLEWMKVYGGQQWDYAYKVIQMNDGGYAVLAQTNSSDGDVTWNRGTDDIWLLRLDPSGNLLWQKTYGSSWSDQAVALTETSDGSFIVLGRSNGSDYDVPFHYGTSQFDYDFFLLKLDDTGSIKWSKTIGGYGNEGSSGSVFEANGGYYFASYGTSRSEDCVDTSWCPNVYTDYDFYLFFLDTSGNILWSRSYGGSGGEGVRSAFWDSRDSSIVMIGTTSSTDFMVSESYNGVTSVWAIKTDMNGNLNWETTLGDTSQDNNIVDMTIADQGYFIGITFLDQLQLHYGSNDMLACLVDTAGVLISDTVMGGSEGDACMAAVPYKDGYAMVSSTKSYSIFPGVNENNNHTQNNQSDLALSFLSNLPLKVDLTSAKQTLKIYPNPAKDKVRIVLPQRGNSGNLNVIDGAGRVIYSEEVRYKSEIDINTGSWAKGAYMVNWKGADGKQGGGKLIIH